MTNLFSPLQLGSLSLENRIVMAPMTRNKSPDNIPNSDVVDYYQRRAEGGTGLIITEGTCVGHKAASGYPDVPFFDGELPLEGWRKVVEAVHAEDGKIAPQLWHVGSMRKAGVEPGGDLPGYSPSGLLLPGKSRGHAMTLDDIEETIESYVQSAKNAVELGFDAIEIHGAHGYLIDQFFWEGVNLRNDAYGGDMLRRSRFAIEIIKRIRQVVPKDFPVLFRYSQWKQQEFTARLAETPELLDAFLKPLADAGVDVFHCSTRRFWEPEFEGSALNLAGWTKKLTGKPTITVGSVGLDADFIPDSADMLFKSGNVASLDDLLERLNQDEFDLVAIGRAMIANPDWANKVKAGKPNELVGYDKNSLGTLY